MSLNYEQAGVNVAAGNEAVSRIAPLVKATQDQNVLGDLGGFAAAYALPKVKHPVLLSATDASARNCYWRLSATSMKPSALI